MSKSLLIIRISDLADRSAAPHGAHYCHLRNQSGVMKVISQGSMKAIPYKRLQRM
jgi:hypothetical protein